MGMLVPGDRPGHMRAGQLVEDKLAGWDTLAVLAGTLAEL